MFQSNTKSFLQFILLILLQAFLLNNVNLFGFLNPYIYLLFFITYRFDNNPTLLILIGFVMGFLLDLLSQGAGGHSCNVTYNSFFKALYHSIFIWG